MKEEEPTLCKTTKGRPPEIDLCSRFGSFVRAHRVVLASANKWEVSMRHPPGARQDSLEETRNLLLNAEE